MKRAIDFGAVRPLTGNEARILTLMAVTALDGDDPPVYWGPREDLARAIGRMVRDEVEPGHPDAADIAAERRRAFDAVKIAIRGLRAAGAIEPLLKPRRGRRAEYAIRLDWRHDAPTSRGRDDAGKGVENPPPTRVENPPLRGWEIPHIGGGKSTPLGRTGTTEEEEEEIHHQNATTYVALVEKTEEDMNQPRCDAHVGEAFPPRCAECDAAADTSPEEVCLIHVWPKPCRDCDAATEASA